MAALNAVRTNLRMKFFYKRLINRGKPRKVALIAVARKLALIAYAIYKTKEPFKEYIGINRYGQISQYLVEQDISKAKGISQSALVQMFIKE